MEVDSPVRREMVHAKSVLPALLSRSVFLGCMLALAVPSSAQSRAQGASRTKTQQSTGPRAQTRVSEAEVELQKRLEAAQAAQKSGNPVAVGEANTRLAALALREIAQLRLIELAYPQAIQLYQRSLDFEERADTRVDLAIAYLQANQLDNSLDESAKALTAEPNDARAQIVRGKTLMSKGDYGAAAQILERVVDSDPKADMETLYSLGVCYLQAKQSDEKVQSVWKKMTTLLGDSGSLHVLFGRAYRDASNLPAAIGEFQRAIALDPRTPHAHYFLGLARLANNEWKVTPESKTEFAKELEYYPHDYLANYMLGFVDSSERKYEESDHYLEAAVAINPDWPEPWLYMGLNASAQGNKPRAEKMFRKAIELTGNDESRSNFQIRRAYIDLGRILVSSGREEEGQKYLAKARELQNKVFQHSQQNMSTMALSGGVGAAAAIVPLATKSEREVAPISSSNADPFARVDSAVIEKANLTAKQREALDAQENHLRAVLGLAFNDMATSEAKTGQYMAALGHYQEAERWDPKISGLYRNLGLSAFRSKNYPEAIRGFSEALKENPQDNPVRAMLGMVYFGADQYANAVKTFAPLGVRGMQDATVGYAWAASLTKQANLKEAAEVLQEYAKAEHPPETRMLIGQLWIDIGDYEQAVKTFHAVLQENPSQPKAHYFAGQADIRWGRWADAEEEFKQELKINPGDVEARFNLGFVCLQQSRVDEAAKIFAQVIDENPNHARAQYNLGKILLDRGEVAQAVEHLEIAARLSPGSDYMHYQLQAAYRKQSRTADADRELAIYKEIKEKQRSSSPSGMGSAATQDQ